MKSIQVINISCEESIRNEAFVNAVERVTKNAQFILGPEVKSFEATMQAYLQVPHAIGVANGTDALVLAMDALGIGPGDEVITTPFTFFASAETISRLGAKPVFVDVLEDTYNMDPAKIEAAITSRTKAIMVVHIFGNPVDCAEIQVIADKHDLFIVEDACQAIGASYDGRMIGSIGDVACFSFFPTKNLGGFGDGGLITTKNDDIAEKLRMLRFHGQKVKYQNEILGYNSRLDEMQAAILNVKFPFLQGWNDRRRELALRYNEAFDGIDGLDIPVETARGHSVVHVYSLMADHRDELSAYLEHMGIGTAVYYAIPLHLQKALSYLNHQVADYPIAEKLCSRALALPMYPELSTADQDSVISAVRSFYENRRKSSKEGCLNV